MLKNVNNFVKHVIPYHQTGWVICSRVDFNPEWPKSGLILSIARIPITEHNMWVSARQTSKRNSNANRKHRKQDSIELKCDPPRNNTTAGEQDHSERPDCGRQDAPTSGVKFWINSEVVHIAKRRITTEYVG